MECTEWREDAGRGSCDERVDGSSPSDIPTCANGDGSTQSAEESATSTPPRNALFEMNMKTPYLTCSRCNSVTFVNVLRIRPKDHQPDVTRLQEYEQLPVCSGCGSTKYLRAGVVSFQDKIEEEQRAIKEFERKRLPATALIQRIARGFLGRLEFQRRKVERERYILKINRSATQIQTHIRGMQARRRTIIERCLLLIKTMHPSILSYALTARPDQPPVFWYDNPGERNILFWNYREFVRRSGGRPPLIKVEQNLIEITKRMLMREHELVSRIQSIWRGLTTRIVFQDFKRQKAWLKGIQQSPAIKIQRLFRGHTSRKRCKALKVTNKYPQQLEWYRQEMDARDKPEKAKAYRSRLLSKYRLEYQVEKTMRMLAMQDQSASLQQKTEKVDAKTRMLTQPSSKINTPQSAVVESCKTMLTTSVTTAELDVDFHNLEQLSLNTNRRRFADIKRQIDMKKNRVRGPRLHILTAQRYTTSTSISPSRSRSEDG